MINKTEKLPARLMETKIKASMKDETGAISRALTVQGQKGTPLYTHEHDHVDGMMN